MKRWISVISDPPDPKDYEIPAHVDAKVLDDIAAWIKTIPRHAT